MTLFLRSFACLALAFTLLFNLNSIRAESETTSDLGLSSTTTSVHSVSSTAPTTTSVVSSQSTIDASSLVHANNEQTATSIAEMATTSATVTSTSFSSSSSSSSSSSEQTNSKLETLSSSSLPTTATTTTTNVAPSSTVSINHHSIESNDTHPHFVHHHNLTRASAANCPDLLASHCICGHAVYDLLEPTHTVYVTNCSNANLTDLQLLQQLPDETEVLLLSHNELTKLDKPLLGLADGYSSSNVDQPADATALAHFQALSYRFANVKVLDLSNNRLQSLHERAFDGIAALRFLDLSNNSLQITGSTFAPHLFKPIASLEQLRLSRAFDDSEQSVNFIEDLTSMLINGNLKQLTLLDLGHNHIPQLTNVFAFCSLPSLQKLLLNDNRFNDRFDLNLNCTPHLHLLDLRNNEMHRLSNATIESFEQSGLLFHLELAGNPFWCDCALRPTLAWLQATRVWVVGAKHFVCSGGHSKQEVTQKALFDLDPIQLECGGSDDELNLESSAHRSAAQHKIVSYSVFASIALTLLVIGSALVFVSQRKVRSRCSITIQQLLQKRQYSPLDKQRARVIDTNCSETAEPVAVSVENETESNTKSNVDEDVV